MNIKKTPLHSSFVRHSTIEPNIYRNRKIAEVIF